MLFLEDALKKLLKGEKVSYRLRRAFLEKKAILRKTVSPVKGEYRMSSKVERKKRSILAVSQRNFPVVAPRTVIFYLAKACVHLLLGAILASAKIFGSASPFGVAMVSASGAGLMGFVTLLGVMAGHVLFGGVDEALHYIAAGIFVYGVAFAFYDTSLSRKPWFMPTVTVLAYGTCRYVALSAKTWSGNMSLSFVSELFVIFVFARAYGAVLGEGEKNELAHISLGLTLILVLDGLVIGAWVSLGAVAAVMATIYFAKKACDKGFLAGSLCGIALDFSSGGIPYYAMALGLAGAGTWFFWEKGKYAALFGYVLCHSAVSMWVVQYSTGSSLFWEAVVGAVLTVFIPKEVYEKAKKSMAFTMEMGGKEQWRWLRSQVVQGLESRAKAFRQLYEAVKQNLESYSDSEDAAMIFRRVAERQCVKCGARDLCWVKDYEDTQRVCNDAMGIMLARGRAEKEDFPSFFRSRCFQFPQFLSIVNEELLAFLYRKQYAGRMADQRKALCEQYREIHSMLQQTAMELGAEMTPDLPREQKLNLFLEKKHQGTRGKVYYNEGGSLEIEMKKNDYFFSDLGRLDLEKLLSVSLKEPEILGDSLHFHQREKLKVTASVLGHSKAGEKASGDSGTWFRREDGLLCILLCDGMGSGEKARESSLLAMRLLENFLKGGINPASALETVNGALSLRGEFAPSTAVDLLTIDVFSGAGHLYKWGAASSYIRKKDGVKQYGGAPVPLGIVPTEQAAVKDYHFSLEEGDFVLLCSDGLLSGEENPWLRSILLSYEGESASELASLVMEESQKRLGGEDDATIIGIKISSVGELEDSKMKKDVS